MRSVCKIASFCDLTPYESLYWKGNFDMRARLLLATMAAGALGAVATLNTAYAQVPAPGTLFVLHSTAQGACPALDWHVVVGENGTLSGILARASCLALL